MSEQKKLNLVGQSIVLMWVATLLGDTLFVILASILFRGKSIYSPDYFLFVTIPGYVIAPFFMLLPLRKLRQPAEEVFSLRQGYEPIRIGQLACITIGAYAISIIIVIVVQWGLSIISELFETESLNMSEMLAEQSNSSMFVAVFSMLAAPAIEEFIFRKKLLSALLPLGDERALALSSLMFGLYHANLEQTLYAIVVGATLGFIMLRTGKLIYSIAVHASINAISVCIASLEESIPWLAIEIMQFILVAAGLVVVVVYRKCWYARLKHVWKLLREQHKSGWKSKLLTGSIIASFLLCIAVSFSA